MSRPLRFIPEEGSLVEITCRTIQGRYLLRPDPEVDDILLGVLGRAQRLYPVEICGYSFLSSHYHLLLRVSDVKHMSDFFPFLRRLQEEGWWVGLRARGVEEAYRQDGSPRPLYPRPPARR